MFYDSIPLKNKYSPTSATTSFRKQTAANLLVNFRKILFSEKKIFSHKTDRISFSILPALTFSVLGEIGHCVTYGSCNMLKCLLHYVSIMLRGERTDENILMRTREGNSSKVWMK